MRDFLSVQSEMLSTLKAFQASLNTRQDSREGLSSQGSASTSSRLVSTVPQRPPSSQGSVEEAEEVEDPSRSLLEEGEDVDYSQEEEGHSTPDQVGISFLQIIWRAS